MKWADLLPEAQAPGAGEREIAAVTADSRQVGPGTLFFALRGSQADGHDFIGHALAAGATGVVAERTAPVPAGAPLVTAPDARRLLGLAAARLHHRPSARLPVVGITGTNGKTTVAWLVSALFGDGAVIGTLGWGRPDALHPNGGTTPGAAVLQERLASLRDGGATGVALEVSSHALDQERLAGTELAGAVWTNLTPEHLDYHGDLAAYAEAKARLLVRSGLGFAVINQDDPAVADYAPAVAPEAVLWRFGQAAGDVWIAEMQCRADGTRLVAATPAGPVAVESRLVGRINVANILAAVATGLALGLDPRIVAARLSAAPPVPGRMEAVGETPAGATVWVDYAHTADALERTLAGAAELVPGKLWCVFGAGGERDTAKRPAMGAVADRLCHHPVLTSDNPRGEDPEAIIAAIRAGMAERTPVVEPDRRAAIERALAEAGPGDGVVIAGKGHEEEQVLADGAVPFSDAAVVSRWLAARKEPVGHDDPG